jgi:acyl-CoA thioesterase FadM
MNLYLRLAWVLLRSLHRPKVEYSDEITIALRVMPNDLDVNRHLNNGRYLSLLDLASVELFVRAGLLRKAIRHRFRPMLGGLIVTYRRGLSLFERCKISIQLKGWDRHWSYFRFEFRNAGGNLCAAGYFKGAFVSNEGLISNQDLDQLFGKKRGVCALPDAVRCWLDSEEAICKESSLAA